MSLPNDPQTAIREITARIEADLIEVRRDIHAHPELAFEEVRTAGVVARELDRLGIAHETGIAKTGVVGLIEGGRPGPVLAIRADMDALPIHERTGLPFASTIDGKMHACGHDIHTTTLLGVAAVLKELAPQLAGTVKLVFQPAEEAIGGMSAMIGEGVMDGPKIDLALALHNAPQMPVGRFGYCRGPALAAADTFEIVVHGRSGHAAHPHAAVDPIVAAASLVLQLQTVVSREVPPTQPVVVTVGSIHGGQAANIIPDSVTLRGTVRTLHDDARDIAEAAIKRLCAGLLEGMRARCDVEYRRGVPSLVNADRVIDPTIAAIRAQFGDVIDEGEPSMGAEDFALMSRLVPSFQLRVGSGTPGRDDRLHNSGLSARREMHRAGRAGAFTRGPRDPFVKMRVCVYGAGAVGGHIAARLAEGGAEVSVVARGANLAAMRANGLVVHAADREMRAKVAASDNPADLGPQDAVIVTTKAPALPAVAAGIAPLLGPETPVVFAMNGIPWWYFDAHGGALNGRRLPLLDPGEALRDAVDPARVIGCVVYSACTVLAPGIIEVENPRSRLIFGEPDGRLSERAADLAKILFAGGLDMQLTAEIRQAIWAKLLMNLSSGPIAVLSQAPPKGFYEEPAVIADASG